MFLVRAPKSLFPHKKWFSTSDVGSVIKIEISNLVLVHGFINTVTQGVLLISEGPWGSLSK
jgi:hypothetical protein